MDRQAKNQSLNGILIRSRPYSETSLLLRWFSDQHGPLDTIAKGMLRPGPNKTNAPDLFVSCELEIFLSKNSTLHTLKECHPEHSLNLLRSDYHSQVVAAYLIELLECLCESGAASTQYYELLHKALRYLDTQTPPAVVFLKRFEMRLAQITGVYSESKASYPALLGLMSKAPKKRKSCLEALALIRERHSEES